MIPSGVGEPKVTGLLGACLRMSRLAGVSEPTAELILEVDRLAETLRRSSGALRGDSLWVPSAVAALELTAADLRARLR